MVTKIYSSSTEHSTKSRTEGKICSALISKPKILNLFLGQPICLRYQHGLIKLLPH